MFQLVYKSMPSPQFRPEHCTDILLKARRNNPRLGITGALIFTGRNFVQALEGPEDTVRQCFETVRHDVRHMHVECLLQTSIAAPEFGRWSMAFEQGNTAQDGQLARQIEYLMKSANPETRAIFERFLKIAMTRA